MATALVLARCGISAVAIERSNYEGPRIGETLPPASRKLLATLGVWERFVEEGHLASFGVRSAWGRNQLYSNDFIFNPYWAGWHVDRTRLDAWLARTAEEAGARVLRAAQLTSWERDEGRAWRLTLTSAEQQLRFSARFLVDATGRAASLARRMGAKR